MPGIEDSAPSESQTSKVEVSSTAKTDKAVPAKPAIWNTDQLQRWVDEAISIRRRLAKVQTRFESKRPRS